MNFKGIEICCPVCHGELDFPCPDTMICRGCGRSYPLLLGIPDLRVFPDPYISFEEDRAKGCQLAKRFDDFDFDGFVDFYYSKTPAVPKQQALLYKRGLRAAAGRAEHWLHSWEKATSAHGESLLDVGCGTAPLLVAAKDYPRRVGIDIAFRWLVVGKKRLAEAGLDLPLICACAEYLPFPSLRFDRVVADSVLEHLRDQPRALAEVRRVLSATGFFFLSTPNRFSLGPDPQTGVWAGGWLPRGWTDALVRRQGGIPPVRSLLNVFSLSRLLRGTGFRQVCVSLPSVSEEQCAHFSPMMRRILAAYDVARRYPVVRHLLYLVGPMFQAVAAPEKEAARA